MNLYLIGKHDFSPVWEENTLDIPLFERLAKASNQLVIIGYSSRIKSFTKSTHKNITLLLVPSGSTFQFIVRAIQMFNRSHELIPADVISASELAAGLACLGIKRRHHLPTMFMVQGDLLSLPAEHFSLLKRILFRRLTLFIAKHVDRVRGVSQKIIDGLRRGGVPSNKLVLLKNRVDLTRFNAKNLSSMRDELRQKHQINSNSICITYLGALTIEKGFSDFVTVALSLLEQHSNLHILIIGDGELREWGQTQLSAYKKTITWAGFIPQAEVQNHLAAGDVYLFTSHHEGMPRVVLEYLAMSKAVISTPVGGIAEVIEHKKNGFLIDVGDTKNMIYYVNKLLENPQLAIRLGSAARNTVEQHHDLEKTIQQQIITYQSMVTHN